MLKIDIAEFGRYDLENAVFDYNGTLAKDSLPKKNVILVSEMNEVVSETDEYLD